MRRFPLLMTLACSLAPAVARADGPKDPGPFLGPMHEAHGGEVIFSSKPVTAAATSDDGFITEYKLGGPLFVRMWGKDSADNTNPKCARRNEVRLSWRASVNGGEDTGFGVSSLADDVRGLRAASTVSGDAKIAVTTPTTLDNPADAALDRVTDWNGEVIPQLVEGDNTIHVVVKVDCGNAMDDDPIIAEGTLKVSVAPGALAAYAKAYGPFLPKARHPESKKLAPKLMASVAAQWTNEDVIGAVMTSPGWTNVRDEWTGAPVNRWSQAYVVVHLKSEKNPNRCRAFDITASEAAMDANRYSPDVAMAGTGSEHPVPCAVAALPGR
ncbi:MAG: hypothetical protein U1F43_33375 [Myxococcota bacterium]